MQRDVQIPLTPWVVGVCSTAHVFLLEENIDNSNRMKLGRQLLSLLKGTESSCNHPLSHLMTTLRPILADQFTLETAADKVLALVG